MEQQNCLKEMESEDPLKGGTNLYGVKISQETFREIRRSLNQPIDETKDDAEARNDFWSIDRDFIYRHHVEPRVQLKDQSRIHQFGKKVLPGLFLGYALYAGGIWKGDILVADIEELENDGRI